MKELLKESTFENELVEIFRSNLSKEELLDKISNYHENDIAGALEKLNTEERKKIYPILGEEMVSDIFTYIEDPDEYLTELQPEMMVKVLSKMDADDVVDILDEMEDEDKSQIVGMLDEETGNNIKLILSYSQDEIGSKMTTNFIEISKNLSIRQATRELITQAGENDNIGTIYVVDENGD